MFVFILKMTAWSLEAVPSIKHKPSAHPVIANTCIIHVLCENQGDPISMAPPRKIKRLTSFLFLPPAIAVIQLVVADLADWTVVVTTGTGELMIFSIKRSVEDEADFLAYLEAFRGNTSGKLTLSEKYTIPFKKGQS